MVCALKLAQGSLFAEHSQRPCVYLVDDLTAELDSDHASRVCELLAQLRSQVFITCVNEADIVGVWPVAGADFAVFHVEQGTVRAIAE